MTNRSKHVRSFKETSVSVLEARLKRVIRPKARLWAMIHLGQGLVDKDAAKTERALSLFSEAERLAESISDRRAIAAALYGTGRCHHGLSNFSIALESLERALLIAEQTGDAECEIQILLDLGKVYVEQSRHDLALDTLTKCAELAKLIENRRVEMSALVQMGVMLTQLDRYDEALEYYTKSLLFFESISVVQRVPGWMHDVVRTLGNMSNVLNSLGKYAEALSILERCLHLCRAGQDIRMEGICQGSIGVIYDKIGDYPNALSSMFASVKLLEQVGGKRNLAAAYGNIMYVYLRVGNIEEAKNFGEKALAIFETIGHKHNQAEMLGAFGEYYLNQGQHAQARRFLKQSLTLSREVGSKGGVAGALIMRAKLEIDLGKFASAEKLLQEALTIASEINNGEFTVAALLGLGRLFNKQAQPDQALLFLERVITIARKTHTRRYEQEAHQMLAETLEAKGDLVGSIEQWKLASSLKEEILGVEKQKALTALQIRSNIEKAEVEKALLRKETKLKSREVERMAMDLSEKTELIRSASRRMKKIVSFKNINASRSRLEELLADLDHCLGERKTIPNEFQLVYRNTLQKLSKKYPDLSPTERKICALLHDGLSTKQIGDMLKMSIRTVDWYRYRIRKKMKLEPWASLTTVLAGM